MRKKTLTKIRGFMKILNYVNIAGIREFNKMHINFRFKKKLKLSIAELSFGLPNRQLLFC